ncbi:hypothetical protein GYMLUDRAFT_248420 [Collybiopsis luxurians FD-317 M1]|uniref:Uncharacterized protein n=1 Tax=Collybiopsis luxurians FD-317 M1 TaxID=944289 RepID=A0A0D0BLY1_9AGAR|nr:hypothetical protein GYMLUDRAFT_248420 [Collybiopsis luxurians FD-317 M1]
MSSGSPFNVDLVTNLVRRQGEVLLRVQTQLGQSQRVEAASNEALEFVTLQSENEAMLMELDEALAGIRTVMSVSESSFTSDAQTVELSSRFQAIDPVANTENRGNDEAAPDIKPVAHLDSTNGEAASDVEPVTEPELLLELEDKLRPDSEHHEIATGAVSPHPELKIPLPRSSSLGPAVTSTAAANVEGSTPGPSRSMPAIPSLGLPPPSSRVASSPAPAIISAAAGNEKVPAPGPTASRSTLAAPSPKLRLPSGRVASSPKPVISSTAAANTKVSAPRPSRSIPALSSELPSSSSQIVPSNAGSAKMHLSIASLKAVCSKLPRSSKDTVVRELCTKVFGHATHLILEHPEALVKPSNSLAQLLITVSWSATDLSAGHLYYLGRYECGPTSKIDGKEYDSLPGETKSYIITTANSIRKDIKTNEHLISSMNATYGIFVAKLELSFSRYDEILERRSAEKRLCIKCHSRMVDVPPLSGALNIQIIQTRYCVFASSRYTKAARS